MSAGERINRFSAFFLEGRYEKEYLEIIYSADFLIDRVFIRLLKHTRFLVL